MSGHWTDDRLIEHLYGVAAEDAHLADCAACRARLAALEANRRGIESLAREEPSFDFLAAQRRKIYARMAQREPWWASGAVRRWASAAVMALVLGGGVLVYEEREQRQAVENRVSDVQLAQEVSSMAQDAEPPSTAPLQGLFEE